MTPDARAALVSAGLSRRDLLRGGGALIVSFAAGAASAGGAAGQGRGTAGAGTVDPRQLDSWLAIAADGRVTAHTGKCELGQGLFTAQLQLVAEELSVPVSRIRLIQCDTSLTPDQGTTSGSQSSPTNFNDRNLALAAATAREALLQRAAARLAVPLDRLTIADGVVSVAGDAARRVSYGELIGGRRWSMSLSPTARRKPAASGKCSARRCRASTCRRWQRGSSSSCTTCASTAWSTAASSGRPRSVPCSRASTKDRSQGCPA